MKYYGKANNYDPLTRKERTIAKMERSHEKKKDVLRYLWENKRHLLKSRFKREKMKHCGRVLEFVKDPETGYDRLYSGNFCKYHTTCLACATRRALIQLRKFEKGIKEWGLDKKNRYFIVLTFRTDKETILEDAMQQVMRYRSQIARNYKNSKRMNQQKKSFFYKFDGMVMSLEVSKKNAWHPHINILACTDKEIVIESWKDKYGKNQYTNGQLKIEWKDITNGSFIHYMRKINPTENVYDRSGIGEIFKYAIKFQDLSIAELADFIDLQDKHQYRMLSTYGCLRKYYCNHDKNV